MARLLIDSILHLLLKLDNGENGGCSTAKHADDDRMIIENEQEKEQRKNESRIWIENDIRNRHFH
eukprot:CAMPEP_0184861000 /NCGR_PEP_ID=MMETSP0580-20130426/5786_1 /TAXON_ID=1118495 /ORGANISM="Dactyliosolen fragilissimus" /LENGTH=64 /DNA_ID=CAMNT_0027358323 /DNA_START=53 /DNA_END=244 /DNA_ORIENTATION=-